MVDNFTPNDPALAPTDTGAAPSGIRGFLNSRTGKIVIGAALLVILLVVVGVLVLPSLLGGQQPTGGTATVPPAGSVTTSATAGESEESTPTLRRAKPLSTVFVFRDIFEPTVKAVVAGTGGSPTTTDTASGDTSSTDVPDLPADTLFVQSVDTVDGVAVATFYWNGQTYTAGEGESLTGTPWRVLSISGSTVTLLYGDSRVTLTVGQGLSK